MINLLAVRAFSFIAFFFILLLLSGDIGLNLGPKITLSPLDSNEWNVFRSKGLHLIHLNISSIPLKIYELRCITNSSNAAVRRISKFKLDESVLQLKTQVNNYDLFRQGRSKNDGGAACYIRSEPSYIQKLYFPDKIENIFFKILSPKTKPIVGWIIYILAFSKF